MNFAEYLSSIRRRLISNHAQLLPYFDLSSEKLSYRPQDGGWSIADILEHISLTSHYLLIIIDKASAKSQRKAAAVDLETVLLETDFMPERITRIGQHKVFPWTRPEHMEPRGLLPLAEIEAKLTHQLFRCLEVLERLPNGEGVLQTTTMSVDGLGRLNVYEYVDFLARHVERHLAQIKNNLLEQQP